MEKSRSLYIDDPRLSRPSSAEPASLAEVEEPTDMAYGKCMCCASELRYPQSVSRFRCPVCDTINDLKLHIRQQLSVNQPLSLKQLKRLVSECRKAKGDQDREKVYEPVEKLVENVFGSWACLNQSFSNDRETSLDDSGLAIKDIHDAYKILLSLNPLLAQHNFPAETKYHHNLLKRVFGMLSNLNNECHQGLVNWFAKYEINEFSGKVDLVHAFLSHRITHAQRAKVGLPAAYESDWKMASAARYPFLVSMGSKMQIMESDAKQQMETKWREAFFSMLFHQKVSMPYLVLRVRRENLIEDSLRQVRIGYNFGVVTHLEKLAQNELDLKKSLRIEFIGEDGVDAGGLRKEWFLLLVRSLFDPQYGMFTYDEDSNLCWFNAVSFENEDQFFLVGIVLGLAIYNSTILDIHLPIACYKKLLNYPVGLADLGVFRPALMRGFNQLLTFEGDVESVFCRSFVAEIDTFGQRRCVALTKDGASKMVTNENRKEFVDLYVDYVLNTSVERQFGAFKRGFYHVCGGNALSLFRPEEIELLVRGSDGPLEIDDLKSQTEYHGFEEDEETIVDFWSIMKDMGPEMQRRLLMFVTGSDRIPATGAANMSLQIVCGGTDTNRLPSAHTCFNQLVLYKYQSKPKLKEMLQTAILESQGFYVK
ncbi:putative E3 ubiquitin-protein ligase [Apophysomyces sp. BC1034]|nr:putative E3 ubiquitin-protein ligase [Apophysomyces sp. BC1034]